MNLQRATNLITKLVKNEMGDLPADSHNILNTLKHHFSQLLNVHGVNGVR
jgi:hypothetical protein